MYGQFVTVQGFDDLGSQQRLKLLHVRVALTQVEVDIAAAPDQFQRFVLHRSIPFNRFTRAEIRSISCFGVLIPCVVLIGSGLRYDLALESPQYIRELVQYHVGGYLKIAPEHTEAGPLSMMMKPGIGSYDRFQQLFQKFSAEAGKKQYLIPYFIAAHPGTTDEDMMHLAVWLKRNGFRADQVQTFYPGPMATATAMYHSGRNPLKKVTRASESVDIVRGERRRRLHKAFLRYHDPKNWPLLREALQAMGRADLIGNGKQHLVPRYQPAIAGDYQSARRKNSTAAGSHVSPVTRGRILTQHTGLPPRAGVQATAARASRKRESHRGRA